MCTDVYKERLCDNVTRCRAPVLLSTATNINEFLSNCSNKLINYISERKILYIVFLFLIAIYSLVDLFIVALNVIVNHG